ncbi:hypothetical protein [Streptomyces sp. NPDC052114]|uniref:hypothetical protein n=1 Tax=unclassified Streptomyces TaxID=2593676 RepID=UPI003416B339
MTSQQANSPDAPSAGPWPARALRLLVHGTGDSLTAWRVVTVVARVALAAAFLSAVADRFGLWGEAGTGSVAWGTFDTFVGRTHDLTPYLSGRALRAAAVGGTVAELGLGLALLLGVALRWSAWLSAGLLAVFGLSMFVFVGPQAPLVYSVFSGLAAATMLAMAPRGSLVLTVDDLVTGRR